MYAAQLANVPKRRRNKSSSSFPGLIECHALHSHSHCGHDHSDGHTQGHGHSHDHHEHGHEQHPEQAGAKAAGTSSHAHSHGHGHSHGHSCCLPRDPSTGNRVERALGWALDCSGLSPIIAWMENSHLSTALKIMLFMVAAFAAWRAGVPAAAHAVAAQQVALAATCGVYALAGLPAAVSLVLDLVAARIDTHVLMNLAVVGTLVTGHALEVRSSHAWG
jgi:hypothetical protein